jgi:hypothetical protein
MLWQSWCPHCKSHRIARYFRHTLVEKLLTLVGRAVPVRELRFALLQVSRGRSFS